MLMSPKGKKMLQSISPIYTKSKIEQAICEAIGYELDSSDELVDEILLQFFPQTATWGLEFWEQRNNLSTNLNEDIEARRAKIIAKMQTRYPINPLTMATILQRYTGADINIIENIAPYTFEVKLTGRQGFPKSLENLYKTVNRIKPSHLSVAYKLIVLTESNLYMGATSFSGETITVYPWMPREISTKGKIDIAMAGIKNTETATVYPRREEI
ncbi:putative XkdT-related protein [uncultured Caudovirales phage]|uniref:Putative XkdT-related protein n=1 Tax=uncultured Caudovirales phage TaxID=2100421 RepID=A0A2H4J1P4_9CAUD|nr:putative XkdT-related protein [uncultured Caudovirales phage]